MVEIQKDSFQFTVYPYEFTCSSRLHEVKMDVGVENITGVQLPGIERCSCPPAYGGYSCEVNIVS